MGARVTRCSGNATGAQRGAYSRVCGASTAFRPVAVGVGGAERGAPMSQSAYRRVCGAATPKGAAQRGCSATATVLNVKHAEAPPRAMRHPCQHRLEIRPGFPILCPSLAIRAPWPMQLFGLVQNI